MITVIVICAAVYLAIDGLQNQGQEAIQKAHNDSDPANKSNIFEWLLFILFGCLIVFLALAGAAASILVL